MSMSSFQSQDDTTIKLILFITIYEIAVRMCEERWTSQNADEFKKILKEGSKTWKKQRRRD